MSAPNSVKIFFIITLSSAIFSACGYWQKSENTALEANTFTAVETESEVPFTTKEPENFQAEIIIKTGETETKTFVARNGKNRRYDYNFGAENEFSSLQNEAGETFLMLKNKKIYAENGDSAKDSGQSFDDPANSLTTDWLNRKADAKFANLGAENDLTKYRVVFGDGENAESIIYVDEKIGLPVKHEFYSLSGGRQTLQYAMELRNFKLQADANLFEIPDDFRKVSLEEFRKILRKSGK